MASSPVCSAGVGSRDIAKVMHAFEEQNTCILSLSIEVARNGKSLDLLMVIHAFTIPVVNVEPVILASYRYVLGEQRFVTVDSAIMFGLYQIDFLLAGAEWDKTKPGA